MFSWAAEHTPSRRTAIEAEYSTELRPPLAKMALE
jgi:hypothetical protein